MLKKLLKIWGRETCPYSNMKKRKKSSSYSPRVGGFIAKSETVQKRVASLVSPQSHKGQFVELL